jgi:hypothetical protein
MASAQAMSHPSDFHPGVRCHAHHQLPVMIAMPVSEPALEYTFGSHRAHGAGHLGLGTQRIPERGCSATMRGLQVFVEEEFRA